MKILFPGPTRWGKTTKHPMLLQYFRVIEHGKQGLRDTGFAMQEGQDD